MTEIAYLVGEGDLVPEPAVDVTVAAAYESVKRLYEPETEYQVEFYDATGSSVLKPRRGLPEAWLFAYPLNTDGSRRRFVKRIVCPIAFSGKDAPDAGGIVAELAQLVEADKQLVNA